MLTVAFQAGERTLRFSVCGGTAAHWQPSMAPLMADTFKQHMQARISRAPFIEELEAHTHTMSHPRNQTPARKGTAGIAVIPILQMGKWKAQNTKMTCFPTGLWPLGQCSNTDVTTKPGTGTLSPDFQTKVLYTETRSLLFSHDNRLGCMGLHSLSPFALQIHRKALACIPCLTVPISPLCLDYSKLTGPFPQYCQAHVILIMD